MHNTSLRLVCFVTVGGKPLAYKRFTFILLSLLSVVVCAAALSAQDVPRTDLLRHDRMLEMYADYKAQAFENVPDMTVDSLKTRLERGGVVILDVRESEEREVSIIPGAIGENEFKRRKREFKDSTIVVYCTIGYRSGEYAKKLRRKGYTSYNLVGGVLAWAHAGERFAHGGTLTTRVHVYGSEWDLAPTRYEAVW